MKLSNFIQNHNIKDDLDQLKSFKEDTINTFQSYDTSFLKPGAIMAFSFNSIPSGFLLCNRSCNIQRNLLRSIQLDWNFIWCSVIIQQHSMYQI